MRIYVEVQVTEDDIKEMYEGYVEECSWEEEEPLDYEDFKKIELIDFAAKFISENSEYVENYLEGDWLKIVEE